MMLNVKISMKVLCKYFAVQWGILMGKVQAMEMYNKSV